MTFFISFKVKKKIFNMTTTVKMKIDPRVLTLTGSVGCLMDAIIELVTNANDAYVRSDKKSGPIWIVVDYQAHTLTVTDNAGGMTRQELVNKIATVGKFSSEVGTRGFFSRGSKDIASIGNVFYKSIKNDACNTLHLKPNLEASFLQAAPHHVTVADRETDKIPQNGTLVTVDVAQFVYFPGLYQIMQMHQHYALRDIFAQGSCSLKVISKNGDVEYDNLLTYKPPDVEPLPLIDTVVHVVGFPKEATFHLVMWKLQRPTTTSEQHGFVVGTSNANHSNKSIHADLEVHPMYKRVCATITSDYLDVLMHNIGTAAQEPFNITPCIRADRTGLNNRHPFVRALHKQVYNMIKFVFTKEMEIHLDDGNPTNQNLTFNVKNLFQSIEHDVNMTFGREKEEAIRIKQDKKVTAFLRKKATAVVNDTAPARYNFTKIPNESSSGPQHQQPSSSMEIKLESNMETAFQTYTAGTTLVVVINANDALVAPCVELTNATFTIVDVLHFTSATARLVARALSELLMYAEEEDEQITTNVFERCNKLETLILPRVIHMFKTEGFLQDLIK
jgi:hypothetical protein